METFTFWAGFILELGLILGPGFILENETISMVFKEAAPTLSFPARHCRKARQPLLQGIHEPLSRLGEQKMGDRTEGLRLILLTYSRLGWKRRLGVVGAGSPSGLARVPEGTVFQ